MSITDYFQNPLPGFRSPFNKDRFDNSVSDLLKKVGDQFLKNAQAWRPQEPDAQKSYDDKTQALCKQPAPASNVALSDSEKQGLQCCTRQAVSEKTPVAESKKCLAARCAEDQFTKKESGKKNEIQKAQWDPKKDPYFDGPKNVGEFAKNEKPITMGAKGDFMKELQTRLEGAGKQYKLVGENGKQYGADGFNGPVTTEKLKLYQKDHRLTQSGEFDHDTVKSLMGVCPPSAPASPRPEPKLVKV